MVWFSLLLWFCLDNCHPSGRLGHLHPRESCNTQPQTVSELRSWSEHHGLSSQGTWSRSRERWWRLSTHTDSSLITPFFLCAIFVRSYKASVGSTWVVPIHSFFFHFLSLIIYYKYRPNLHHWLYFIKKGRHQLQSYVGKLRITFAKHRGMTVSSVQWADPFFSSGCYGCLDFP